jgi:hypothetical protein
MDEFIMSLVGGLLILALLFAFFGGTQYTPQDITLIGRQPIVQNLTHNATVIGPSSEVVQRSFTTDIDVSFKNETNVYRAESKRTFNGLLFGSAGIRFSIQDARGLETVTLRFNVTNTNNYAPLVIEVNNKVEARQNFNVGRHEVRIDVKGVNETVIVDITPGSSNWRLWSPAVYDLDEIELETQSYYSKFNEFSFELFDEYDEFREAKIVINATRFDGKLVVEMNGEEIFHDLISGYKTILFNKSVLRRGTNHVLFRAEKGSDIRGSATIYVFYQSGEESFVEKTFTLYTPQYVNFQKGTVRFYVEDVMHPNTPGAVSVKITCDNQTTYTGYETARLGSYSFEFGKINVCEGVNTVRIGSLDGAVFAVRDVTVEY